MMDLETENRIAAILLKEAAELRRQAEREGVRAYLEKPNVRFRPNSRFLTATVLGAQQANRVVEVNELWRVRQKEQELEDRLEGKSKDRNNSNTSHRHLGESSGGARKGSAACSSDLHPLSPRVTDATEDRGLRDEELEEFLNSKAKRGKGSVGPRMDETGPYLASCPDYKRRQTASPEAWVREDREHRVTLGPEKPSSLRRTESSDDESHQSRRKKAKKDGGSGSSKKQHSKKHKSKEKSNDRKKRRKI